MLKLESILNYCFENDCSFVDISEYVLQQKQEWFVCLIENWELVFSCCVDSLEEQNADELQECYI